MKIKLRETRPKVDAETTLEFWMETDDDGDIVIKVSNGTCVRNAAFIDATGALRLVLLGEYNITGLPATDAGRWEVR